MPSEFREIHISFIWAETILDSFTASGAPEKPLGFLSENFTYAPFFEKARSQPVMVDAGLGLSLQAPWPKPTGQRFWQSYLEQTFPSEVKGAQAWKFLVPLRGNVPFIVTPPAEAPTVEFDVFFYPYGLALLATVQLARNLSPESAVEEAFKVRRQTKFNVQWQAEPAQAMRLEQIADLALMKLRNWGWGNGAVGRRTALDPFTIFTITHAAGFEALPLDAGSVVHRTLEAVTNWRNSWKNDALPGLEKVRISSKDASTADSRLLYGGKRGRALWFPASFMDSSSGVHGSSLFCYHRNLTSASLQVESLCGFARETAKRLADGQALAFFEEECARRGAGLLGRLFAGESTVYRSWSVHAQIEQNGFVKDINAIRGFFGMTPIA